MTSIILPSPSVGASLSDWNSSQRKPLTGNKRQREESLDSIASSKPVELQIPVPKRAKTNTPISIVSSLFQSRSANESALVSPSLQKRVEKQQASSVKQTPHQFTSAWTQVPKSKKAPSSKTTSSATSSPDSLSKLLKPQSPIQKATSHLAAMREWTDLTASKKPPRENFPSAQLVLQNRAGTLIAKVPSAKGTIVVKTNQPQISLPDEQMAQAEKTLKTEKELAAENVLTSMTRQKKALAKVTFDQAALKLARSKKESQKKSLETLKTSYQESQSEAVNLATIQKIPHTVRYLGSSTISPFVHAVKMECLPPDLISIIKKRGAGLSIKETQAVAKAGFEFILNMEKNSFIHKDIKPQNIAFDEKTLSVKFFDFESLAVDQQPHRDKTTLKFRPPEFLIQKEVHVTYDIWSFGVTLHLCYTGKPLFKWINNQGMHPGSHLVKNDIVAAVISLVGLPGDESLKSKAAQTYFKLTEQGYKLKTPPSSNVILPNWGTVEADLLKAAKMKKEPKSQALLLLDLLKKMLVLVDSTPERIMPQKALKHPFIKHKKEERKESR